MSFHLIIQSASNQVIRREVPNMVHLIRHGLRLAQVHMDHRHHRHRHMVHRHLHPMDHHHQLHTVLRRLHYMGLRLHHILTDIYRHRHHLTATVHPQQFIITVHLDQSLSVLHEKKIGCSTNSNSTSTCSPSENCSSN